MNMEITKQDWKLFRQRLPDWQEAYMDRLNREYAELLAGPGNPSDKFWALEKRIRRDRRSPGVQLQLSRTDLLSLLTSLLADDVITLNDLEGFSQDLQDALGFLMGWCVEEDTHGTI